MPPKKSKKTLLAEIIPPLQIRFRYVDAKRHLSERDALLIKIKRYYTDSGALRIELDCVDTVERGVKSFLAHRVLDVTRMDTGEVFEPEVFFRQLIRDNGGTPPDIWPSAPIRIAGEGIDFDHNGYAIGWVYGVHCAFRPALDITLCPAIDNGKPGQQMILTRGEPRHYQFDIGDLFHSPYPWGERTKHSLQVVARLGDGMLQVKHMLVAEKKVLSSTIQIMSDQELADRLQNG